MLSITFEPQNRLVTAELERRWKEKLERVAQLERAYAQAERDAEWNLNAEERRDHQSSFGHLQIRADDSC
jgi:hypothetical protein